MDFIRILDLTISFKRISLREIISKCVKFHLIVDFLIIAVYFLIQRFFRKIDQYSLQFWGQNCNNKVIFCSIGTDLLIGKEEIYLNSQIVNDCFQLLFATCCFYSLGTNKKSLKIYKKLYGNGFKEPQFAPSCGIHVIADFIAS